MNEAPTRHKAEPDNPAAIAGRSPYRSTTNPQAKNVSAAPIHGAARTRPMSRSERLNSARRTGTITGKPKVMAAKLACAAVPAARTTHL
jgi:hypothetical protein